MRKHKYFGKAFKDKRARHPTLCHIYYADNVSSVFHNGVGDYTINLMKLAVNLRTGYVYATTYMG